MITLSSIILGALVAPNFAIVHEYPIPGNEGWDLLEDDPYYHRQWLAEPTPNPVQNQDDEPQF